jgi:transcriptional regulator with XRE-family HTH domain
MHQNSWDDARLAKAAKCSRSYINRLKRGLGAPSTKTAMRLAKITGLEWHLFLEPEKKEAKS